MITDADLERMKQFLDDLEKYKQYSENSRNGKGLTIGSGPSAVHIGSVDGEIQQAQGELLRQKLAGLRGWAKALAAQVTGKSPHAQAMGVVFDAWDRALEKDPSAPLKTWSLDQVADVVRETIGMLEVGVPPRVTRVSTEAPPKAFVAHSGKTRALDRLCEFVRALGVEPIVVELRASQGRSVDTHVEECVRDSDCGIVFATGGGINDAKSGKEHPRLNVIDEFARLRNRFPDKVIILLEKGVDFPSNVSEFVHERFTRNNLERAFLKVARELRAFGIIRAQKQ